MITTYNWLMSHWDEVLLVYLSLIGAASIIVKWTPTPKDDAILGKIKDFVSRYVALNPKK